MSEKQSAKRVKEIMSSKMRLSLGIAFIFSLILSLSFWHSRWAAALELSLPNEAVVASPESNTLPFSSLVTSRNTAPFTINSNTSTSPTKRSSSIYLIRLTLRLTMVKELARSRTTMQRPPSPTPTTAAEAVCDRPSRSCPREVRYLLIPRSSAPLAPSRSRAVNSLSIRI